jgi:hypothetical protein
MSPDGSHAALYLPLQGSIVEFNCVDGIVSEHPLEVVSQLPDGLAPEDDSSANPGRPPAEMPDVVEALAVSPDGTIAAALASNRIAIIQAHP